MHERIPYKELFQLLRHNWFGSVPQLQSLELDHSRQFQSDDPGPLNRDQIINLLSYILSNFAYLKHLKLILFSEVFSISEATLTSLALDWYRITELRMETNQTFTLPPFEPEDGVTTIEMALDREDSAKRPALPLSAPGTNAIELPATRTSLQWLTSLMLEDTMGIEDLKHLFEYATPCLPNLRKLTLCIHSYISFDDIVSVYRDLIGSPHIEDLKISLGTSSEQNLDFDTLSILFALPNLKRLHLNSHSISSFTYQEIEAMASAWPCLVDFRLQATPFQESPVLQMSFDHSFDHAKPMENLVVLPSADSLDSADKTPAAGRTNAPVPSPLNVTAPIHALTGLVLKLQNAIDINNIMSPPSLKSSFPRLSKFTLHVCFDISRDGFISICRDLTENLLPECIQDLEIDIGAELNCDLDIRSVSSLFAFPRLKRLCLSSPQTFCLDDKDIMTIAANWPFLTEFTLQERAKQSVIDKQQIRPTLSGVASLAHACPDLSTLEVEFKIMLTNLQDPPQAMVHSVAGLNRGNASGSLAKHTARPRLSRLILRQGYSQSVEDPSVYS
ncbi:hypothetical protein K474DRAFT_1713696 [Panus rudis PR-1116 ss-1]|nr:hypothetical protein K474DRAFT_1713696 [Panus rudis PR-1116 ss-1]